MTAHKFKIGDRVKWRDDEGRELSGTVMVAADERGQITVREHVDWRFVARWHESHLSLDVPEPEQFATNREAELGAEIIDKAWTIAGLKMQITGLTRSCDVKNLEISRLEKIASTQSSGRMEDREQIANQQKEIERLNAQITDQRKENAFIVSRVTAEIGNGHRERIAREAALMGEALALDSLREIAKTLGDQSCLTAQGLREKTPALAKCEMKRLEAARKELAQTRENERWCCDKLSKLANELSAERVAKTSAQNELADLRKDLADLRAISKRLAL